MPRRTLVTWSADLPSCTTEPVKLSLPANLSKLSLWVHLQIFHRYLLTNNSGCYCIRRYVDILFVLPYKINQPLSRLWSDFSLALSRLLAYCANHLSIDQPFLAIPSSQESFPQNRTLVAILFILTAYVALNAMSFDRFSNSSTTTLDDPSNQYKKRFRFRNLLRRKRIKTRTPSGEYVASKVKNTISSDTDLHQEKNLLCWPVLCIFTLTLFLAILGSQLSPHTVLKAVLLIEFFFCSLPMPLANWMILLLLLLQMDLLIRLELVIGIMMLNWLNRLDWIFAWYRVGARIAGSEKPQIYAAQANGLLFDDDDDDDSIRSRASVAWYEGETSVRTTVVLSIWITDAHMTWT